MQEKGMKNPVQARHILISHMNKNSMILPPLYMLVGSIYICGSISDVMQIKLHIASGSLGFSICNGLKGRPYL